MTEVMASITAPFDVSGIHLPEFAKELKVSKKNATLYVSGGQCRIAF